MDPHGLCGPVPGPGVESQDLEEVDKNKKIDQVVKFAKCTVLG